MVVAVAAVVSAAAGDGRLVRCSSSAGPTWSSLKIALAPAAFSLLFADRGKRCNDPV